MSSKDDSGTLSLSANSLPQLCIKILNRSLENTFLLSDPFFIQTIPLYYCPLKLFDSTKN